MASTEPAELLHALDATALAQLDALVIQSHWNQTAADWALFHCAGSIHVLRDAQGTIIASGAVLPMGRDDAWISMILVDPAQRGGGLGRRVFEACLQAVEQAGRTAWLDATPAGEALYLQYAFQTQWRLARWERAARPATRPLSNNRNGTLDTLATLDAEALGLPRASVLQDLVQREGSQLVREAQGFAVLRQGRVAQHIGPLIATHESVAAQILRNTADALDTRLFIDVPDGRALMHAQLVESGFTQQRPFARMRRGNSPHRGQTAFIHAIAGPEYG